MDADLAALQRFAEVPAIVESAPGKAGQAAAMARLLAAGRFDLTLAGPGAERYRAVLDGVRAQVRADLGAAGYRIEVFDLSAPDPDAEARRISARLAGRGKAIRVDERRIGPHAFGVAEGEGRQACVVVGLSPHADLDAGFRLDGQPPLRQGLDDATVHRLALWHELGHCVLGAHEGLADMFALLMALRHTGAGPDGLSVWASAREIAETSTPDLDDPHIGAKGLWQVIARAEGLRAEARFMAMDTLEVAALAKALWADLGLTRAEEAEVRAVRRAVAHALAAKAYYLPDGKGMRRVDFGEWIARNSDIPELGRLLEVTRNLAAGARPMPSFTPVSGSFRATLGQMARRGDPVARGMARAAGSKDGDAKPLRGAAALGGGMGFAIPYALPRQAFHDQVAAYDPACHTAIPAARPDRGARGAGLVRAVALPLADGAEAEVRPQAMLAP